jgi:hypothetical protein
MSQNPFSDSFKAKFGIALVLTAQNRRIGLDEAPKVPPRVAKVAGEGMSVS